MEASRRCEHDCRGRSPLACAPLQQGGGPILTRARPSTEEALEHDFSAIHRKYHLGPPPWRRQKEENPPTCRTGLN